MSGDDKVYGKVFGVSGPGEPSLSSRLTVSPLQRNKDLVPEPFENDTADFFHKGLLPITTHHSRPLPPLHTI